MASALQERLDPVAMLFPPAAAIGADPAGSRAFDDFVVDVHPAAPEADKRPEVSAPGRFSALGTAVAVALHILVAVSFYLIALRLAPDMDQDLGDAFEVTLAQDKAGQPDGMAAQAPDGAPKPGTKEDPQAHAPQMSTEPQEQPTPAAPPVPPQPPSFSAMPMPTTPPVPDTADAWAPRVQAAPRPPTPPPAAPAPPPRPVAAAAPHVVPRPTMQRSVDIRNIPGQASTRDLARGSDSGSFEAGNYGSEVFRAIDRVRFYPPRSCERGEEGSVLLRVVIGAGGKLLDAYVARGSGVPDLDAATIEMAHRAHYPPVPRGLKPPLTFNVPIEFGIRYLR